MKNTQNKPPENGITNPLIKSRSENGLKSKPRHFQFGYQWMGQGWTLNVTSRGYATRQQGKLFLSLVHIPSLQAICEHPQEKGQQNYDKTMHSTHINKVMTKDIGININSWHLSKIIQWLCFLTTQIPNSRWFNFLKHNLAGFSYQCSQKSAK